MKTNLLLLLGLVLSQFVFAQDIIVKVNGEEIKARVIEITADSILYHSLESENGQRYRKSKSDFFMVRFANGTKEVFIANIEASGDSMKPALVSEQFYRLGQQDARVSRNKSVSRKSQIEEGTFSTLAYQNNLNYIKGFEEESRRRKTRKAAVGLGLLGGTAFFLYMVSNLLST